MLVKTTFNIITLTPKDMSFPRKEEILLCNFTRMSFQVELRLGLAPTCMLKNMEGIEPILQYKKLEAA